MDRGRSLQLFPPPPHTSGQTWMEAFSASSLHSLLFSPSLLRVLRTNFFLPDYYDAYVETWMGTIRFSLFLPFPSLPGKLLMTLNATIDFLPFFFWHSQPLFFKQRSSPPFLPPFREGQSQNRPGDFLFSSGWSLPLPFPFPLEQLKKGGLEALPLSPLPPFSQLQS